MIEFESLGHINIVVEDIDNASAFYERAFGAVPFQEFPHFRNVGFARSAGFLEAPEAVDVSIRFLRLPTPEGVILELMEYHHPAGGHLLPEQGSQWTQLRRARCIAGKGYRRGICTYQGVGRDQDDSPIG